jgi:CheY-like chemotaxis protein
VATSPVQLVFDDPIDVPDLFTDEGKVAQILRNFISNAMKFTEAGEIRVSGRYDALADTVSITVSDTGIGIAPEDQARIFEQFVQVDSAKQRQVKGTGLGLPLSRKLASLLRGGITVQSTVGKGSRFTLTIAAHLDLEAPNGGPEAHSDSSGSNDVDTDSTVARPTVLVVDDEEMARYLVRKQLSDLGVFIEEARSGQEGLDLASERRPDVIVLDLAMPEMDGLQVLQKLRSNPATRGIPVVVHTSKIVDGDERDLIHSAASAFVRKGAAGADSLRDAVEQLVRAQGR